MKTDWSKYVAPEEDQNSNASKQVVLNPEVVKTDWSKYAAPEESGFLNESVRHVARTASRIGETLVGMPGDVINMVEWLGSKLPKGPKFLEREPNFIEKAGKTFLKSFPTSSDIKKKSSELTNGFTDPQSAAEEFGDSIVELSSSLLVGKDPSKIKNLLSAAAKASGAKGASKVSEKLGAGEGGQFASEIGTLWLMGLKNQKMADRFVGDKFKKAKALIPKKAMVNTSNLTSRLESLENELSKGISTPSKNEIKSAISELKSKVSGGSYPAQDLVESYHNINERMNSKGLFGDLDKTEKKNLQFRYGKLKDVISKEINEYGKRNPKFLKEWREANEGYATIQDSKKFTRFLESHIGKLPRRIAEGIVIEAFLGHPQLASGTAASFVGIKTGEVLYRVAKSPTLRSHYINVVKSAGEENLPAMIRSLSKLEAGL